jgi:acetylornithine deacetylase/succinyl-diaminopimelate desuccinylase-like protein
VSIDGVGPGNVIVNGGVGSERYRVTFAGPGGHSYSGFGLVNPAYALASAVREVSTMRVSDTPRTTFNVGRVGGGTSVNSIPSEAWMEVDLRSESPERLAALGDVFVAAMHASAADENAARSTTEGLISVDVDQLGSRPAGMTESGSALVETAAAVTRVVMGVAPELISSSTDANLPMSLGVPAIAIDSGLLGGRAHAPDEWIDVAPETSLPGLERVLLLVVSLAGVD